MSKLSRCISILFLTSLLACQPSPQSGLLPEVSCQQAQGLWTQVQVSCDGEVQSSLSPVTYTFSGQGQAMQTQGTDQCESTFEWSYSVGQSSPTLEFLGENNVSCSSEGSTVSSCDAQGNTCNQATDFTGVANGYSLCVIRGEEMSIRRSVSVINNPDGLSYCNSGQEEVLTLRKGEHDPNGEEPGSAIDTARAVLEFQHANPFNFGTLSVGTRRSRQLTVTNIGEEAASSLHATRPSPPFAFSGGSFPGTGGTCLEILNPGESCLLSVDFRPQHAGTHSALLALVYFDGRNQKTETHNLIGVGSEALANLALSHGPFYSFPSTPVGGESIHQFILTNAGGGAAHTLQAIALEPPFAFTGGLYPGLAGSCTDELPQASSCTLEVEFRPQSEGNFNGRLEIHYSDGLNTRQVQRNLFGVGTTSLFND